MTEIEKDIEEINKPDLLNNSRFVVTRYKDKNFMILQSRVTEKYYELAVVEGRVTPSYTPYNEAISILELQ